MFCDIYLFTLKKQVEANVCVTMDLVKEALDQLRGAVMIVYPMGLPPHDPIRMEFENQEDLTGTQVTEIFSAFLKGILNPKLIFCRLVTLMSFQTCMTSYLLWNKEEDILRNVCVCVLFFKSVGSDVVWFLTFF